MMSHGPAPEPHGGGEFEPSAEVVREIQALVDRAAHAFERGDFSRSEACAAAALQAAGLYVADGRTYAVPAVGVRGAVPVALHPFIGKALALEASRVLGRGEPELAFRLARDGASLAPGSIEVLSALRTVVRDNAARGELGGAELFAQLDHLAAAGITYLSAAYGIVDGHAPMNLIATRDHHRVRVQKEIETVVRDHLAAAEHLPSNPDVAVSLYERGAETGLAGLALVGLPDMMAGLTEMYRHHLALGIDLHSAAARSTAALLEGVGLAYRGALMKPFAFVALGLAERLDPARPAAGAAFEALREEFRLAASRDTSVVPDVGADLARWRAYRTREIPLGWNFGARGNVLFADAFYRVRELEAFSLEFAREVAHDYALIDRGGAVAAALFVRAAPVLVERLSDAAVPPGHRFAELLRVQSLLRYIESRGELPREVVKPAHHLAHAVEGVVTAASQGVPDGTMHDVEGFFRVIRTQHSS